MSKWSEEDDRILKEMHKRGETGGAIARKLGRSRNSVLGRLHRQGLLKNTRRGHVNRPVVPAPPLFEGRQALRSYKDTWREHHADARDLDILHAMAAGATDAAIQRALPRMTTNHLAAMRAEIEETA